MSEEKSRLDLVLRALLVFIPIAFGLELAHVSGVLVFAAAGLAIVPLAGLMGTATERLADTLGAGVGGLLNATMGNAAELIIALFALHRGLDGVVKASITGSIIGNVLLVLGLAMVAGGVRRPVQRFNPTAAGMGSTLLTLSAIALVVPAVFHFVAEGAQEVETGLSVEIAVVLFVAYALSLVFTLRTHSHLYAGEGRADGEGTGTAAWSGRRALAVLVAATVGVAVMSELLVGAIDEASEALGMTEVFVGVILVAIVGNAAEHSTAVTVAIRDKMDLALNIAIGSSIQVALFVAPVLVFASFALGNPMDLIFTPFEVLAVVVAVLVVNGIVNDGESNWMEGTLLLAVYLILGIAFYALPA